MASDAEGQQNSAGDTAAGTWARWRSRRWVRWGLDVAILLVVFSAVGLWQTRGHLKGQVAPFSLPVLGENRSVSLDSLRGKPVLLAFWAPWCGVCKVSSRNVSWLRSLVGERAHVLSVAAAYQNVGEVQRFVEAQDVRYPVLLEGDVLVERFGVTAFPSLYFLDEEGRVKRSAVGYTTTLGLLWRLLL